MAAVTRRSFLASGGAAALGLGLGAACAPARQPGRLGTIIGAGKYIDGDTGEPHYLVCQFDLDGDRSRAYPIGFFGHGLAIHPGEPRRAALFEKQGPGACELDLWAGEVVRPIETPPERAFYGHGAYSPDGALLYATETELDGHAGLVNVRDAETLEELGRFPTHGKNPHDCVLIDGGRTVVVTNGGAGIDDPEGTPSVAYVEAGSAKLLDKVTFETPRINAGHLAISERGDLVAVSAPRDGLPPSELGGVTIRSGGGPARTMSEPAEVVERMVGESLSLCIDDARRRVGVTNPDGNIVTFWDIPGQRLVKTLDLPLARGIAMTLDRSHLVISYGRGSLTLLDPEAIEPVMRERVAESTLSGSHIFTWAPPA